MMNTDMLEWMNDIDAKYLLEAEQPVIRQHRRGSLRKTLPAVIAAAAAVTGVTVSVSAAVAHNIDALRVYFGSGASSIADDTRLPGAAVYANDNVSVTVETVINDGMKQLILLTAQYADGTYEEDPLSFCQTAVLNADGLVSDVEFLYRIDIEEDTNGAKPTILQFDANAADAGETLYLAFSGDEQHPGSDLFDGIQIPITFTQNTAPALYAAENGAVIRLSEFELVYQFYVDEADAAAQGYDAIRAARSALTGSTTGWNCLTLTLTDGTECPASLHTLSADMAHTDDGKLLFTDFRQIFIQAQDNPSGEGGSTRTIDPDIVQAIDLNGVTYTKQ